MYRAVVLGLLLTATFAHNLPSSYQRVNENLLFHWDFSADNTSVTIGFKWKVYGWVGMGFGPGMEKKDLISIEFDKSANKYVAVDRWSIYKTRPDDDETQGGKNDLTFIDFWTEGGYNILTFSRLLDTKDAKFDAVLTQGKQTFAWAAGATKELDFHDAGFGNFETDFVQGHQNDNPPAPDYGLDIPMKLHAFGFLIIWGILIDLPLISVRHFKSNPNYLEWHRWIMIFIGVFTLIAAGYFWIERITGSADLFVNTSQTIHLLLGTAYMALIIAQLILGAMNKDNMEADVRDPNYDTVKSTHKYIGYFIYILSKVNVYFGTTLYDDFPWLQTLIIGWYPASIVVRVIAEFILAKAGYRPDAPTLLSAIEPANKELNQHQKWLMDHLKRHDTVEDISYALPTVKWAMFGSRVLDLTKFNHPGGNFILDHIVGREIGRFIFGAYNIEALEANPDAHRHTAEAFKIMADMYIGDINYLEDNILVKKVVMRDDALPRETNWKLVKSESLSPHIARFDFASDDFLVKTHLPGVRWFGRHFNITSGDQQTVRRQYTTVLCMFPNNVHRRKELVKAFDATVADTTFHFQAETDSGNQHELSLFVKKYQSPTGLSGFMHAATPMLNNVNYMVEGPIGESLGFTPKSNGTHHLFAAGTGILPVLDFLDYLLHRTIGLVSKNEMTEEQAQIYNPRNEDFSNTFGKDFAVVFYGAFVSKADFIGSDIVYKLAEYSEKWPQYLQFKAFIKLGDSDKVDLKHVVPCGRFDERFVKQNVPSTGNRYHICGPPQFNYTLNKDLLALGVDAKKISFI